MKWLQWRCEGEDERWKNDFNDEGLRAALVYCKYVMDNLVMNEHNFRSPPKNPNFGGEERGGEGPEGARLWGYLFRLWS